MKESVSEKQYLTKNVTFHDHPEIYYYVPEVHLGNIDNRNPSDCYIYCCFLGCLVFLILSIIILIFLSILIH